MQFTELMFNEIKFRNCGAAVRVCAFVFIFLMLMNGAWAQQPAQNAGAIPSATQQTGNAQAAPKPDAPSNPAPANQDATPSTAQSGSNHAPSLPPAFDPVKRVPLYETIQEDWSSLDIGVSQLTPEPPLEAQTDEGEGFTRTLLQLKWRPGDALDVYVILPKGVKKPPAVLYLYGYKDDTDRFKDNAWCQRVTEGGVAAVGFVSALSGHRFHDRPMRQWFVSELQESVGSTVHDVKFILDYLARRGDIDMDRIGMFGQASGGTIALLSAAADPRIKAADALDPWGDWPVWLEKSPIVKDDPDHAAFLDPDFLKRVAPLDPVKWLPTLKSTHVRIQQVMENIATPDACKDAIKHAALPNAEVVRYEHTSQFADAAGHGHLFDWIKMQVKAAPALGQKQTAVAERGSPASEKSLPAATQR